MSFEVRVPGKWILAGEHAVLRGSPALVFPLKSRSLELVYHSSNAELELELFGEHGPDLKLLVWGVLEKACELKSISRSSLTGTLKLKSSLPLGAGLGASAALCVAMSHWFVFQKIITTSEQYEFARTLENLFHGESSGVDIAVALSQAPLKFIRGQLPEALMTTWKPKWYLSYSGKRGVTLDCVKQVKELFKTNEHLSLEIDAEMERSVMLASNALMMNEKEGFPLLKEAIENANICFHKWGLDIPSHQNKLMEAGANATKPTGSGGGGYVLSLWDQEPPESMRNILISCED